jgi:hypothetical protein
MSNYKWLRTVMGFVAGGLNLYANGTSLKQVALAVALAALGGVTHLTSTEGSSGSTKG